jgi:hypothetical protein
VPKNLPPPPPTLPMWLPVHSKLRKNKGYLSANRSHSIQEPGKCSQQSERIRGSLLGEGIRPFNSHTVLDNKGASEILFCGYRGLISGFCLVCIELLAITPLKFGITGFLDLAHRPVF